MSVCIALVKCLIELGCLEKIFEAMTGIKCSYRKALQYLILIVLLMINLYINICGGSSFLPLAYYFGIFCIFIARYRMNIRNTVIYTILSFFICGLLELLVYVPCNLIYLSFNEKGDCAIIVVPLVFIICFFVERKQMIIENRKWIDSHKDRINFWMILLVVAVVFIIGLLEFSKGMSWGEGIYLSVAVFLFLILIYKFSGYQMEIECHKQYADKYGEVVTQLRERQHKFMNQLDSVYALCQVYDNYDDLVKHQAEELESLRKYLMPGRLLILDRPLVVSHIYTKLCEAKERNIDICSEFSCSLEYIDVPDIFIIEIIGNLLDNAMDEVMARGKNENIRLCIKDNENEVYISVGNEHDKIPYKEYSSFFKDGYSSKGDGRGVGLPYVKKIVKKYHGHIETGNVMYGSDNYFVISVYLKK